MKTRTRTLLVGAFAAIAIATTPAADIAGETKTEKSNGQTGFAMLAAADATHLAKETSAEFAVNVNRSEGQISPLWFGHNLEYTRSAMWNGLSAQMLRNRKFAGKPEHVSGVAMEWYPIGSPRTLFVLVGEGCYTRHATPGDRKRWNEILCQHICSYSDGGRSGIGQDGIPLQEGRRYEVRLALQSAKPMKVSVGFFSQDRTTVHVGKTLDLAAGAWAESKFEFPASHTDPSARMEISFDGIGELAIGAVSLLPTDNFHGMRSDVVELLKEIGTPILRWPGGNFAGDYRWQDGLLPVDQRAPLRAFMEIETLPHTHGADSHEVGIDEFIALCRRIGAEPFISVNFAWDSPDEIAAWVEYCNGSATTKWGKVRAERGHPEPYRVKFWSLGNELGYGHMEGPNTPAEYADRAKVVVAAMRKADPSIVVVASGIWDPSREEWFMKALSPLAQVVDHISHHDYSNPFGKGYTEESIKANFTEFATVPDRAFDKMEAIRGRINANVPAGRFVGISFDEWNAWYAWYRTPCVMEGVYAASMLDAICRRAQDVGMTIGCYFQPVNEGAIVVNHAGSRLTPVGQAFALYKAHHGNNKVSVVPQEKDPLVGVVASRNQESREIVLTLLNKSPENSCRITLNFAGTKSLELSEGRLLTSEDILPGSRFREESVEASQTGNRLSLSLPKHSVARLRFHDGQ